MTVWRWRRGAKRRDLERRIPPERIAEVIAELRAERPRHQGEDDVDVPDRFAQLTRTYSWSTALDEVESRLGLIVLGLGSSGEMDA